MDEFEERAVDNLCRMADVDPSAELARITWTIEDAALVWIRENRLTDISAQQFKNALGAVEFRHLVDRSIERGWAVMEDLISQIQLEAN